MALTRRQKLTGYLLAYLIVFVRLVAFGCNAYVLQGDTKQLGSLVLQAPFSVWLQNGYNRMRFKSSPACRHLFLYEQAIMFCKLKQQPNSTVAYVFKTLLKVFCVKLLGGISGVDIQGE